MIVENPVSITEETLRHMARRVKNGIGHIYLHWTAGYYGQPFGEYHLCIDREGTVYVNCRDLTEYKPHTWLRNSGAIGIALCCGAGAECAAPEGLDLRREEVACDMADAEKYGNRVRIDYGIAPPAEVQIEVMAKLIAILCFELDLPIAGDTVMTHCEAAFKDGYGPGSGDPETRWDLWFLPDNARGGLLVQGGELLRGKARFYLDAMEEAA